MKRKRRRKCLHCGQLFTPDPRNRYHQRYCTEAACRRASKAASQQRWQSKAENRDYFCDPLHVQRVQAWRARHPHYWRRQGAITGAPLQELMTTRVVESNEKTAPFPSAALQDLIDTQPFVLIGLIANLTGSALQDDIALAGRKLQQLGRDILTYGGDHEQSAVVPRTRAPTAGPVQLG